MALMTSHPSRHGAGTPARPRLPRADRRRQLLEHAKGLFASLGYQGTTMDRIARAAGVTEPVLYRHFENKKALFLEVLREVRAATLDRWGADMHGTLDPRAVLHQIADRYLGTTREHALEFRIMHRTLMETDDEEISAFLRQYYLDSEKLLAGIIQAGQERGEFRRDLDPRIGAWELIRTALGYTLTLPLGIPLYDEAGYLPRAIDCLLHCLSP
jgi:AcrR family transcriptional regulator